MLLSSPSEHEAIWKGLFTCLAHLTPSDSNFKEQLRQKKAPIPMLEGFELKAMYQRRGDLPDVKLADFEIDAKGGKKALPKR